MCTLYSTYINSYSAMSTHLLLFDELRAPLVRGVEALLFAALHGLDALPPLLLRALPQLLRLPLRRQQLLEPLALLRLKSARRQRATRLLYGLIYWANIFAIEEHTAHRSSTRLRHSS